ncbi:MAG TPA: asparagine synthase (glutamine-hydrolyzing) [Candidatus Angelobacter sp.]|nr:asparagine synthase (glutamine-hydrolyzing) [Candidatus Angelobacter sp.]
MCGIVGYTHKNWTPPSQRIREATATLFHRGPDQQGVFQSNFLSAGAARLKIIDLAAGDQPIFSEDGDAGIAFNGEIYNHLEIRRELEKLGHRFASHSDTETVLRAFLQWDKDCFAKLRGMFAVALWKKSEKRLVLARDRMGIKPLYIKREGEDVFFGSELKAIFIHPEIDRRLSLAGLDCYLSLNYVPCPWTLVEGIEKLPPGYWLEWRDGEVTSRAYWTLPFTNPEDYTLDSAKEELDSLLKDSVREHMISDVPLGIWLSGGMDSTTILHYASQATNAQLKTFSISFRGRSFDEAKFIHRAVQQYGTDHQELDLTPAQDLRGAIEEFAYYSDEPSADAGSLPVWFLSKLCKSKTTVALSGEGADELFGGYITCRADMLARWARRVPAGLRRLGLAAADLLPVSDEKISFEYKVKRFLEGSLLPPNQAHVFWNGTFSDQEKLRLMREPLPPAFHNLLKEMNGLPATNDALAQVLWFDQNYYLADDILVKSDRMSMAHSVEVRPPFLDHRIVEFAAKLPARLKIRGSQQKLVLSELRKDKLPSSILQGKKTGFDIPAHEWLRGPLQPMLVESLREGIATFGDLFRGDMIESIVTRHLERKANSGYHLWGLMILFQWMKKWRIQAATEAAPQTFLQVRAGSYT